MCSYAGATRLDLTIHSIRSIWNASPSYKLLFIASLGIKKHDEWADGKTYKCIIFLNIWCSFVCLVERFTQHMENITAMVEQWSIIVQNELTQKCISVCHEIMKLRKKNIYIKMICYKMRQYKSSVRFLRHNETSLNIYTSYYIYFIHYIQLLIYYTLIFTFT